MASPELPPGPIKTKAPETGRPVIASRTTPPTVRAGVDPEVERRAVDLDAWVAGGRGFGRGRAVGFGRARPACADRLRHLGGVIAVQDGPTLPRHPRAGRGEVGLAVATDAGEPEPAVGAGGRGGHRHRSREVVGPDPRMGSLVG